jgi:hypothetical protein
LASEYTIIYYRASHAGLPAPTLNRPDYVARHPDATVLSSDWTYRKILSTTRMATLNTCARIVVATGRPVGMNSQQQADSVVTQ